MTRYRSLLVAALAALPSVAAAQTFPDGHPPLLWVWAVAALALIAAIVLLLFRTSPRERARAHAMARSRRKLEGRS